MAGVVGCLGPIFNSFVTGFHFDDPDEDNEDDEESHILPNERAPCESCKYSIVASNPESAPSSPMHPPAYQSLALSTPLINLQDEQPDPSVSILEDEIDRLSTDLRKWSLEVFGFAELAMKEFKTHDLLVKIFEQFPGWVVTPHAYGIETAVKAVFKHGIGGQTIGFNSEMDALPEIGHACGHPLIFISGIAAALSTASALKKTNTPGTVILLGTPAEETIGGKIKLIKQGAYRSMDACLMIHPAAFGGLLGMLAITQVKVEYFGKNAHAAAAPWEGINALDAAVSAYVNISVLRQQIRPDERVHGIIQGTEKWVPNVIPDYVYLRYDIRAPTREGMEKLKTRVFKCFEAAASSTGCEWRMEEELVYADLVNNPVLAREYQRYMEAKPGIAVPTKGPSLGSTDFGDVSYEVPSIHPIYAIPTEPGQGNHTRGFTKSAATEEAHRLTLQSAKGIAVAGWKVLADEAFAAEVRRTFGKSNQHQVS